MHHELRWVGLMVWPFALVTSIVPVRGGFGDEIENLGGDCVLRPLLRWLTRARD